MKIFELFSTLKKINKTYYTFSELQIILGLEKLSANKRIIDLQKQGFLEKLGRDIFVPSFMTIDEEKIAGLLYQPGYLSFESALDYHGVLEKQDGVITFATRQKSIIREVGTKTAIWSYMPKTLFFDYDKTDRFMIASGEKALCDLMYLSYFNNTEIDFKEINYHKIRKSKIEEILKVYPNTIKDYYNQHLIEMNW